MGKANFKLLIRNLRTGKNAKLKIQTTADSVKLNRVRKSLQIPREPESDNSEG
jgi:hypothetical protein